MHWVRFLTYFTVGFTLIPLASVYADRFITDAYEVVLILLGFIAIAFWLGHIAGKRYWKWRMPKWTKEMRTTLCANWQAITPSQALAWKESIVEAKIAYPQPSEDEYKVLMWLIESAGEEQGRLN